MTFSTAKLCSILTIISVVVMGCETIGPDMSKKLPLGASAVVDSDLSEVLDYYQDLEKQEDQQSSYDSSRLYRGTGKFLASKGRIKGGGASRGQGKYTLNFDEADLGEVVKIVLKDILKKNYVINPKVGGRVTLETPQPLTKEELIPTLEMLLRMNGVVLIKDNDLYRIEPVASALAGSQSPRIGVAGKRIPPGYQVQIIPLRFVSVQEMQKILEPLLPPKAIIRADIARNLLMVAGTPGELGNILETISVFDIDMLEGMSVGVFELRNVDPNTVITELGKLFGDDSDSPVSGMFRLIPIERLNAILVITPQPVYLDKAKLWIDRLDKANTAASGGVHVYRVQNVDAVELAATLNDIFSGKKKKKDIPSASVAPRLKAKEIKGKKRARKFNPKARISIGDVSDVRIIADEPNNSLIIVATAQEYEVINSVLEKLDVVPLQVLIEAEIFEITLSDGLEFGLSWFIKQGGTIRSDNDRAEGLGTLGGLTDAGLVGTAAAAASTGGFSYAFLNASDKLGALFRALADDSKLKVISSPSLMVLNNQEATIKVGDQISLRTSESVNTSGSVSTGVDTGVSNLVTNQIQQRDTGVTLTVKPRVNPGGLVILEIEQKVDTEGATTGAGGNPNIFQRQIKSTVAVESAETLVLGGLIRETRNESHRGFPILSKIPLIGPLFGETIKSLDRTELVVLVTPRVIEKPVDARSVTLEFKRKLTGIYEQETRADEDTTEPELVDEP